MVQVLFSHKWCKAHYFCYLFIISFILSVTLNYQAESQDKNKGPSKMKKIVDIKEFKLEDTLFWPIDGYKNEGLVEHFGDSYEGILVEGPAKIEIDKRETFPAISYYFGTINNLAALSFSENVIFTLMELDSNRLIVFKDDIFRPSDEGDLEEDPEDEEFDCELPKGTMVEYHPMEIREALDLSWNPSRYILTTVMRDNQSNRVVTELVKSDGSHKTPEFRAFQKEKWEKTDPPSLYPGWGDHHSYEKVESSPDLAETSDIKIKVPSQIDLRTSENWVMNGSFRLPLRIQEIVKVKPDTPEKSDPEIKRPTAVKGIHLLLVREKDGEEQLFSFQIPSFDNLPEENQLITGHFNIDFLKLPRFSSRLQTYYLYAFSGDVMVGPFTTTLFRSEDPEEK